VLIGADKAYQDYGIPVTQYNKAIKKAVVRDALIERGVVFERLSDDKWISKSLTPLQLLLANSLLDLNDTRTNKKKCQDLGIPTGKYNSWIKDPVFQDYLQKRARQLIGDNKHEADLALLDKVRSGDMKAISLYYEFTGQFTPASKTQSGNVDIQAILVKIIEIINEEVNDPKEILAISTRLRSLIGANNIARALVGDDEPIEIPQVVANRQVPEELAGTVDLESRAG
jgi:hypothetical protein